MFSFKSFTKFFTAAVTMFAVTAMVTGCGNQDEQGKRFINIATGGTAGTYYPVGGAIAEIINKNMPDVNASAQSTSASVANINMLKDGQVELAIIQNDIAFYASNGTEMFANNRVQDLRGISTLYPETCQFVTLASSGITDISALKGKKVAVGAAGSGAEANARQILEAYGITYDDVEEQFLSFAEGATALKDGVVDAAFVTAGAPTASIQDVATQNPIRVLSIGDEQISILTSKYPYYTKTVIDAGTYTGFDESAQSVSVMAMLVATNRMSDDDGYNITKALFSNTDRLEAAHAVGKFIKKETARDGMPIGMNEGASKFFNE